MKIIENEENLKILNEIRDLKNNLFLLKKESSEISHKISEIESSIINKVAELKILRKGTVYYYINSSQEISEDIWMDGIEDLWRLKHCFASERYDEVKNSLEGLL